MLEFRLFGPFSITDRNGQDRRPKLSKSRAILAMLAATPGHRHSRAWFQSVLWGDRQPTQAMSSLRAALADIRRSLGPDKDALISDSTDIALNPDCIKTDLAGDQTPVGAFLEGFDVPHADGFEDWLRQIRSSHAQPNMPLLAHAAPRQRIAPQTPLETLYLAGGHFDKSSFIELQCDTLVDGLAKSFEEFGLGQVTDGRFRKVGLAQHVDLARKEGYSLVLATDAAQSGAGVVIRFKVLESASARLLWSKSYTAHEGFDPHDPAVIAIVADFISALAHRLSRDVIWTRDDLTPDMMALAGINHAFKLGAQNFELADRLLKKAHALDPKGVHLAWRGFLRSFQLCELECDSPEIIIEEGISLARRAVEEDPHNSIVLALSAHVENIMDHAFERGYELSTRALDINRCNPLAWASLGLSTAYLGNVNQGRDLTAVGAHLASGARFSAQAESWASAAAIMAGDMKGAMRHASHSHEKSRNFAPAMRYLSALYCLDGKYDKATEVAEKLRLREPGFSLDRLSDDGYPVQSLRQAKVLSALPSREV